MNNTNTNFTDSIADVLKKELEVRDSLVFISCQPDNYAQNDDDSHGMHGMFAERNMPFAKHCVIDNRTKSDDAINLIREASCIFLMGGNATLQFKLMCDKGLLQSLKQISMELPICLMTDESAIFIKNETVTKIGQIYQMKILLLSPHLLHQRLTVLKGKISILVAN